MTLGDLVAFVSLMLMLVWPVDSLGWILANGQEAMTAADRIYEVFDTEPTIVDRAGAVAVTRTRGALRFEGVGFRYAGSSAPVLHDVDLDVRPGETLAVVGVTGSGKTTLTALVPRLYDVTAGRITLDGRDVRDLQLGSLRRLVVGGVRGRHPVLLQRARQPDARPRGRHRRGGERGAGHRPGVVRPRPAVGARHPDRGAGPVAVRRPAAAAGPGPRGARPAAGAGARRPAVGAGRAHRVLGRAGAAPGAVRHHRAARRAPALDRRAGRPGRPAGERHDHRRRHPLGR